MLSTTPAAGAPVSRPSRQAFVPAPDAALVGEAPDRVVLVDHAEAVNTTGSHTFFKGVRADDGQPVFIKHNRFDRLLQGLGPLEGFNPVFSTVLYKLLPNLDRLQDMSETMLSHFLKGYFEGEGKPYSGVTYQEVLFNDPRTQRPAVGIAAPMVPNLASLGDVAASKVSNPEQAVELTLMRGLLFGDYDVTFHDANTPVIKADGKMSDGTPLRAGQSLAMDFGEAGNDGLGRFGVPFANARLLQEFPNEVKPAVDRILQLDGPRIRQLVEEGGTHVTGWTPQLTDHYAGILTNNVERLRTRLSQDPTWLDPSQTHNWMRQPGLTNLKLVLLAVPSALHNYGRVKASGVLNAVSSSDHVASVIAPELRAYPSETHRL